MTGFTAIDDQRQPLKLLHSLLKFETVPHALLFVGIEGVGKLAAALAFAMASNCETYAHRISQSDSSKAVSTPSIDRSCGQCKTCRKIKSGNHPDILRIQPIGSVLKIDQIRDVCKTLALKPNEARKRFVIIERAQKLNPSAANALLKVLEEPPKQTFFVLIADQSTTLLPTIVSRCQKIRFHPVAQDRLASQVALKTEIDAVSADVLARMAQGSFSKALKMADEKNKYGWFFRRKWLLRISGLDRKKITDIIPAVDCLAMAQSIAENKEQLQADLEILESYIRDMLVIRDAPDMIIHADLADQIEQGARIWSQRSLLSKMESLQIVEKNLGTNANLRLMAESLCMQLAAV